MRITLVTDSTSDLPQDLRGRLGVRVVPLYVNLSGAIYRDWEEITPTEIFQKVREGAAFPTTSQPSPEDFARVYREALEEAPSLEEVLEKAYPLLADATLVIHNAAFDLGFLRPALEGLGYRLENPVVDSLRLARRGLPGLRRYGLDALSEVLELPRRTCHRALEDVERTLAVVHEVYYMLTSGRPRTLWELGR